MPMDAAGVIDTQTNNTPYSRSTWFTSLKQLPISYPGKRTMKITVQCPQPPNPGKCSSPLALGLSFPVLVWRDTARRNAVDFLASMWFGASSFYRQSSPSSPPSLPTLASTWTWCWPCNILWLVSTPPESIHEQTVYDTQAATAPCPGRSQHNTVACCATGHELR